MKIKEIWFDAILPYPQGNQRSRVCPLFGNERHPATQLHQWFQETFCRTRECHPRPHPQVRQGNDGDIFLII